MTVMTVETQATELIQVVTNVALFASTDTTLPVLCAVHFRAVDGFLTAEATDRYTAAQQIIRSADGELDGLLVDAKDAMRMCKAVWRELRRPQASHVASAARVTIAYEAGAESATFTLAGLPGPGIPWTVKALLDDAWPAGVVDTEFGRHHKRLAKLDGNPFNRRFVFRACFLARLAQVETDTPKAEIRSAEFHFTTTGKAALVTVGLEFRALVMPVAKG